MSTRIEVISPRDAHTAIYRFESSRLSIDGRVDFGITVDGQREVAVGMDRDAFIAAVEAELDVKVVPADAIVIERGDLPEVQGDGSVVIEGSGPSGDYTYWADADEDPLKAALAMLAIAQEAAHPPVDEAQVEAVTAALYEATRDPQDINVPDVARRLVEAGVRVGTNR